MVDPSSQFVIQNLELSVLLAFLFYNPGMNIGDASGARHVHHSKYCHMEYVTIFGVNFKNFYGLGPHYYCVSIFF